MSGFFVVYAINKLYACFGNLSLATERTMVIIWTLTTLYRTVYRPITKL